MSSAERVGAHLGEFGDQLDALAFSAGQRRARLAEAQVAEAHVRKQLHRMLHAALRGKELHRLVDAQRQGLADALALEQNAQGLGIEAPAAAHVAQHLHVGQEAHLDALHALALAGFAAAARGVERESAGGEAADARVGGFRIQPADRIPESDVGGRTGARGLADRRLVDLEHPADRLPAVDRLRSPRARRAASRGLGAAWTRQQPLQIAKQHVARQRGLAGTRHARDHASIGRAECAHRPCADCAGSRP